MDPIDNITNYKLGIFYYNREDSRFIVPKREKELGWTFNFGHYRSWLVMALIVMIPLYYYFF